jgi:anti-anti-sigma factor
VALEGVYASRPDLVILDLSEVTLFDPSALATLVATRRRLAGQQATLSIRRPSPIGARILRTSGLARVLDFG